MSLRYKGGVISATPPTTTGGENGTAPGVWTLEQQMQAQAAGTWPLYVPFGSTMRSLRFNSADSAYLNRTPASAGNRKTWTISMWVKRNALNVTYTPLIGNTDSGAINGLYYFFTTSNTFKVGDYGTSGYTWEVETTQVFRDPSAWYHLVVAFDTTQSTASNRVKIYVNGSQVTAFGTATYPSQNADGLFNTTALIALGRFGAYTVDYASIYLTEVVFVDGQALTPSSFGQTNSTTGVWEPKTITGLTYGTNGFYLKFQDNSGTTATTLGKDSSGNGNNWTPNNFSVTAGVGNDSLVDTPYPYGTDTGVGGEVRGNYCTWNPLWTHSSITLANGNLQATGASSSNGLATGTIAISSGKWYWESTVLGGSSMWAAGIVKTTIATPNYSSLTTDSSYAWNDTGSKYNGQTASSYGATYTTNDVIGIAVDLDAGTVVFYKNGSSQGTAFTGVSGTFVPMVLCNNGASVATNFGQRPFAYTAPSGFKALVTQNLPTPTIVQPDDYFNTVLYTGTGATRSITGVGFAPDFVWNKGRDNAVDHCLNDIVRGANKQLVSNTTGAELTYTNQLTSFDSDGFSLGADNLGYTNYNNVTYVAWNWKGGGAGVSNTAGTISSTVSANTTSGCSIVTYTGTGSSGTVGHGLGVAPSMIIVKNRSVTTFWAVYHASLGNTKAFFLNAVDASVTSSGYWNNTSPTSTVFTVNTENRTNGSGNDMVAYCFAPVAGYSAFGSYPGNGVDPWPGVFVYTGFRPAWVLIKGDNAANAYYSWGLLDIDRNTNNQGYNNALWANRNAVEGKRGNGTDTPGTGDFQLSFTANGFCVSGSGAELNASNATYYWAAFAENPFKYALAR